MSMRQRTIALVSLVLLVFGLCGSVPVYAEKSDDHGFRDLKEHEWAVPFVSEVQAKGLMKGTGEGTFEPEAPLSRAQAITISLRLMDLESTVQGLGTVSDSLLPYADRAAIPDWARAYVAVAVKKQILPLAEDGLLRPEENASRLWVSVLLIRALGLEAEAQSKMAAKLPFKDADLVPASLRGYAAAAVDHQLIQGFPDGTFRPNDPLTRAQAAALLSRSDSKRAEQGKHRSGTLYGELFKVDVSARQIKLAVGGGYQYIDVAPNAALFIQEQAVDLTEFRVGTAVMVVLGTDGKAVLIQAKQQPAPPAKQEPVKKGEGFLYLTELHYKEGRLAKISYTQDGKAGHMQVAAHAKIQLNGYQEMRKGDKLYAMWENGVITYLKLYSR